MEGESGVTRSIIDDIDSSDNHGDQMEGESGVTGSIMDERHSWDIQQDRMENESCVTRGIIDELHASDIQGIKWKVKVVLLEVSLVHFILGISNEI